MVFPEGQEAGWHVLIGDNGTGKSSIVRGIAATLIGPEQIAAVLQNWEEWLSKGTKTGSIRLEILPDWTVDSSRRGQPSKTNVVNEFTFNRMDRGVQMQSNSSQKPLPPSNYNWGNNTGWFSVAYGPFRRFTGGDTRWSKVYYSAPKAGAHLSVFGEDIALTEALDWLKELDRKRLKARENMEIVGVAETPSDYLSQSDQLFNNIKSFINSSGLLPHNSSFEGVDIDGNIIFIDSKRNSIKVTDMSDGYRSILSLTFELIRQMERTYGANKLFGQQYSSGQIQLPGVVLIDEIDAHLHPTWQTRIGQWFTHVFPNIQFIVTTHSPLICRGCMDESGHIKGSIWRISAPDSAVGHGLLNDTDRDRLIYGNVLDAYGTGAFGENIERTKAAQALLKELAQLDKLHTFGQISHEQDDRRLELQKIFTTDVIAEF